MISQHPALIILEAPNTAARSTHKYRCMICTEFWRISDSSYGTVRQMRRDHMMYVVVCYSCYLELDPMLPEQMRVGRRTNIRDVRQLFGYQ